MLFSKRFCIHGVLFLLLALGCGDTKESGHSNSQNTVKASVATAVETVLPVIHEAVGTIQAKTTGTISSKVMGTVLEIHVKEGDRVKAGDLLVTLDSRQVAAQLAQAEAAVSEARQGAAAANSAKEAARANADLAGTTFDRYRKLLTDDSVSGQEYDEVASRFSQAQSALKQAEEMASAARYRVKQAESGLSSAAITHKDATVRAPFDGFVGDKQVAVGDLTTPGRPLLTLESDTGFEMALDLPETLFGKVAVDQPVLIRITALENLSLTGRIAAVSKAADPQSRSFLVKVALPENAPVHAGMFARADIPIGSEALLLVPPSAIVNQGQLTGIFFIDSGNVARFRLVRTGRTFETGVEIISGMKAGTRFVTLPPPPLVDGTPVEAAP